MKKIIFIIALVLAQAYLAVAQERYANSNLKKEIETLKGTGEVFHPLQLLNFKEVAHINEVGDYFVYGIDKTKLQEAFHNNYNSINFILPLANGNKMEIYMTRNEILTDDFEESIDDELGEKKINSENGVFYHGVINEVNKTSLACISIFEDELMGVISDQSGNWNLGKLKGRNENEYTYFNDHSFHIPISFHCEATHEEIKKDKGEENLQPESTAAIKKCVRIFIDCDRTLFNYLGTTAAVRSYVLNMFNVSSTIYGNDDVSVAIYAIHFWTSSDPFSGSSSLAALNDFRDHYSSPNPTFNGDVAHLIAHDAANNGGRADLKGICKGFGYSDIHALYPVNDFIFPTYTWDAKVFTHELGHNFGSRHTQWCGWLGGPIDNCAPQEDDSFNVCTSCCVAGPPPADSGGTIMSYCQNTSYGIYFLFGFGSQPGDTIRKYIAGRSCITNCSNECRPYISVGVPITSGNNLTFKAQLNVYGSNDINSGATANFQGGSLVILNPGFYAKNGSDFHGYISSCTPVPVQNNNILNLRSVASENIQNISIKPNPFNQSFDITFNLQQSMQIKIQIFDAVGKSIKSIDAYGTLMNIDMSEFNSGVYFVHVASGDEIAVRKLIKMQ